MWSLSDNNQTDIVEAWLAYGVIKVTFDMTCFFIWSIATVR